MIINIAHRNLKNKIRPVSGLMQHSIKHATSTVAGAAPDLDKNNYLHRLPVSPY
jgi:hypothetical protein